MPTAVIVDVIRTATGRGKPGGALSGLHPVELLGQLLKTIVERHALDPVLVDDVIIGCLAQVGEQSVNIARNASLAAGFPVTVPGTTVDRQCGSSLQAATFAAQGVIAGAYDVVIAGGVELMSKYPINFATLGQDPFGASIARRFDGGLISQGISAELIAEKWGFTRDDIDAFSARSHRLASEATDAGSFEGEIIPITVTDANGLSHQHTRDETIRSTTTVEGLAGLKPAFYTEAAAARFPQIDWKITPGNSSPLSDGASVALIMSEEKAVELGLTPRARFVGFSVVGSDPIEMLTGVIPATERVLERSHLSIDDMDSYEVNEAFAPVPLAWQYDLRADPTRLNPRGGGIALGHALGSTGTRILGSLLTQLELTGGRYGLEAVCEGQGMANATIIERL